MLYRKDRQGQSISQLGFGCMRFSRNGGGIDMKKAEREILRAVELGINYFDTAYIYPGSEVCLGEIVSKNGLRDKIHIATKLPQYLIRDKAGIEKYFQEQLARLKTDHVDYYLMHMLTDIDAWHKLQELGIEKWIKEKKAIGSIKQIGFSFHGNTQVFLKLLDAYDWDFCQIQYNYMDEVSQAGRIGLQAAAKRKIPVIVMEPLRGGKLVNLLPREARSLIDADSKGRSAADLAFSWLWDQPEVTCVLSGMNSLQMLEDNCRIASIAVPGCLSKDDFLLIDRVRSAIDAKLLVGCTGCGYCMPCPKGVDIPGTFRCYNETSTEGLGVGRHEYFQAVALRKDEPFATQCVACGRCEAHCPQHLPIIKELKKADKVLRPWHYRIAINVARRWLFGGRNTSKDKGLNA